MPVRMLSVADHGENLAVVFKRFHFLPFGYLTTAS
jgi:hypothetical protein